MSTSLQLGNGDATSTAAFRDMIQKIEGFITGAAGWVLTADTGQIDPTTVTAPAGTNTDAGFRMYKTGDALTTWYLKITYRRGASNEFAIVPLLGTATNGSGTLSGQLSSTITAVGANSLPFGANATQLAMAGANGNWLVLVIGAISGANQNSWGLAISRTVDAAGAVTDDGMEMFAKGSSQLFGGNKFTQQFIPKTGTVPAAVGGWIAICSTGTTSTIGTHIRPGIPITWGETVTNNPCLLVALTPNADFSYGTANTFTMSMYAATHTYLLDGDAMNSAPYGQSKCAWRFE